MYNNPTVLTPSDCNIFDALAIGDLDTCLYTVVDGTKIELLTTFGASVVLEIVTSLTSNNVLTTLGLEESKN
jgi:hypothetical protein